MKISPGHIDRICLASIVFRLHQLNQTIEDAHFLLEGFLDVTAEHPRELRQQIHNLLKQMRDKIHSALRPSSNLSEYLRTEQHLELWNTLRISFESFRSVIQSPLNWPLDLVMANISLRFSQGIGAIDLQELYDSNEMDHLIQSLKKPIHNLPDVFVQFPSSLVVSNIASEYPKYAYIFQLVQFLLRLGFKVQTSIDASNNRHNQNSVKANVLVRVNPRQLNTEVPIHQKRVDLYHSTQDKSAVGFNPEHYRCVNFFRYVLTAMGISPVTGSMSCANHWVFTSNYLALSFSSLRMVDVDLQNDFLTQLSQQTQLELLDLNIQSPNDKEEATEQFAHRLIACVETFEYLETIGLEPSLVRALDARSKLALSSSTTRPIKETSLKRSVKTVCIRITESQTAPISSVFNWLDGFQDGCLEVAYYGNEADMLNALAQSLPKTFIRSLTIYCYSNLAESMLHFTHQVNGLPHTCKQLTLVLHKTDPEEITYALMSLIQRSRLEIFNLLIPQSVSLPSNLLSCSSQLHLRKLPERLSNGMMAFTLSDPDRRVFRLFDMDSSNFLYDCRIQLQADIEGCKPSEEFSHAVVSSLAIMIHVAEKMIEQLVWDYVLGQNVTGRIEVLHEDFFALLELFIQAASKQEGSEGQKRLTQFAEVVFGFALNSFFLQLLGSGPQKYVLQAQHKQSILQLHDAYEKIHPELSRILKQISHLLHTIEKGKIQPKALYPYLITPSTATLLRVSGSLTLTFVKDLQALYQSAVPAQHQSTEVCKLLKTRDALLQDTSNPEEQVKVRRVSFVEAVHQALLKHNTSQAVTEMDQALSLSLTRDFVHAPGVNLLGALSHTAGQNLNRTLVSAEAGQGKTTLCNYLTYESALLPRDSQRVWVLRVNLRTLAKVITSQRHSKPHEYLDMEALFTAVDAHILDTISQATNERAYLKWALAQANHRGQLYFIFDGDDELYSELMLQGVIEDKAVGSRIDRLLWAENSIITGRSYLRYTHVVNIPHDNRVCIPTWKAAQVLAFQHNVLKGKGLETNQESTLYCQFITSNDLQSMSSFPQYLSYLLSQFDSRNPKPYQNIPALLANIDVYVIERLASKQRYIRGKGSVIDLNSSICTKLAITLLCHFAFQMVTQSRQVNTLSFRDTYSFEFIAHNFAAELSNLTARRNASHVSDADKVRHRAVLLMAVLELGFLQAGDGLSFTLFDANFQFEPEAVRTFMAAKHLRYLATTSEMQTFFWDAINQWRREKTPQQEMALKQFCYLFLEEIKQLKRTNNEEAVRANLLLVQLFDVIAGREPSSEHLTFLASCWNPVNTESMSPDLQKKVITHMRGDSVIGIPVNNNSSAFFAPAATQSIAKPASAPNRHSNAEKRECFIL